MEKNHELALKEFEKNQLALSEQYFWDKIDGETFNKQADLLFTQAVQSGIAPSTPTRLIDVSQRDIMAYALEKKNQQLVERCFEHGYSPDNLVLYDNKKIPALSIASPNVWPLFKKYNAHFDILFFDPFREYKTTVLHQSLFPEKVKTIEWLLKETTIDINQPDGNGDTIGHCLVPLFDKEKVEIFDILKNNGFNPFQKNNKNQTPKECAEYWVQWYKNRLSSHPNDYDFQEDLYDAITMFSLWEKYENEYLQNNAHKQNKKLCYCEKFIKPHKKDIIIESSCTSEQIMNAYNFFPADSLIGLLCKKNPDHNDCIVIAKHYMSFNDFHLMIEKEKNLQQQEKVLEKEKEKLCKPLYIAYDQLKALSLQKKIDLLDSENQRKYSNRSQLSDIDKLKIATQINLAAEKHVGVTALKNQQDIIEQQLQQIKTELFSVWEAVKKQRRRIQGYYSALDFNICLGKSSYHKAVKNLLEMIPDEERHREAAKINEGLHNAYHNKKQV